jgi:hypothetical protein
VWAQLDGSDRAQPYAYYKYLVASFPTLPPVDYVVQTRTWLLGRLEAFQLGQALDLADPEDGIDAIVRHAVWLGLPKGVSTRASGALHLLHDDDEPPPLLPPEADASDTLLALRQPKRGGQQDKRYKPQDNDCDYCDAGACQSNKRGGPTKCICRWNSTFDLDKIGRSNAKYCKLARKWHEANPSAPTLKNVRFTIKPTGAAGSKGSGSRQPARARSAPLSA